MQLQPYHPPRPPLALGWGWCLAQRGRHGVGLPSGFHTPVPGSLRAQAKAALQSTVSVGDTWAALVLPGSALCLPVQCC